MLNGMTKIISAFFIVLLAMPAWAAKPVVEHVPASNYNFTVDYDVYAGGMHLLDITQQFSLTDQSYSSDLIAKPTGFFSKIVPWEGHYLTTGLLGANGRLLPQRHLKSSRWGDERDETIMLFDKNGDLTRMTDSEWVTGKTKPAAQDVTPSSDLSKGAVDLVTAVLRMLQTTQTNGVLTDKSCNVHNVVFDGKRRFMMDFTDVGTSTLTASNYNGFNGKARHCVIEVKPLAGFNGKKRGFYKIQEDSRTHGALPSLWLMPAWAASEGSAAGPPIPVRMLIKSEYGAILVHATKVTRK